ncbi:unnamed protein product [Rotaria magnacalcarata]|uniref:Uncharacterized protein n=6 Tax=Rotaria magnacalcarata TaxID=392030 RepID=A0A816C799_9BILA|nr:unnamed protein product [Rotaria magnacalcarata]
MPWICDKCQHGRHTRCESTWSCDCQCNVGGDADASQKGVAIIGGLAFAIGGLFFAISTGGVGPILLGGAMLGGGVSSTWNGAEKAIKGERINGKTFALDVAFGAITGVATGGIGVAGEVIATNVVKQGVKEVAKVGVKKLAVRAATGAVTGVAAKAIDEVKQCSTTDKKWNEDGTVASWVTSAAVGALGGVGSHVSSNLSKSVTSGIAKSATRVAVSGTTAAVSDATVQGVNIAVGNQDSYDVKRTFASTTTSAIMTVAQEGTKKAIYHANGGKDNMLNVKSNKKVIEDKVPEKNQQELMERYENLKKIHQSIVKDQKQKANTYTTEQQQKANHQATIAQYDKDITKANTLKTAAIQSGNTADFDTHKQEADKLISQKKAEIKNFQATFKPTVSKKDLIKMNNDNAHFLVDDRLGQVSVDIPSAAGTSRGAIRVTFDYDTNRQGDPQYKFSGYTNTHNYNDMPRYGQSDYYTIHQNYDNNLKVINGEVNNYMCNHALQDDIDKERQKKKRN